MDSKEVVDRLLRGSANIDRMRKEIDSVIGMLQASLSRCVMGDRINEAYESPLSKWKIWNTPHISKPYFECSVKIGTNYYFGFSTDDTESQNSAYNVESVYKALPELIEGIRKRFPKIEELWQYVLNAADVYED